MAAEPNEIAAPDTGDVRSDIQQTRARIAATIDAIEARLQPRRMVPPLLLAIGAMLVAIEIVRRRRRRAVEVAV